MSRCISAFIAAGALLVSVAFIPAYAAISPVTTIRVMVRLSGSPLAADPNLRVRDVATLHRLRLDTMLGASRTYETALSQYQSREITYAQANGISMHTGWRFQTLFNGFETTVPVTELDRLRHLRNVVSVTPERTYKPLIAPGGDKPLLDRSLPLIHAPEAWAQLGGAANAGRGTYIAQIDSGIDITQPCFSDKGFRAPPFGRRSDTTQNKAFTNNKVVVARGIAQDPLKQVSAADTGGHGTFGAAIEACDANTPTPLGTHISGVAPGAYLFNYNVFPESAVNTSDSQILSALQFALQDGADVANLSLGQSGGDLNLDFEASEIALATASGLSVAVSAGNAGPTSQSIQSPAMAPDAITVGASTNSRGIYSSISVDGPAPVPAGIASIRANEGSFPWQGPIGPFPTTFVGLGRIPNDDPNDLTANDFANKDLKGKIALIQRGITFFAQKINNAAAAGAVGAIIFDNQHDVSLVTMDVRSAKLPATFISQKDGQALLSFLQAHPDTQVTMNSDVSSFEVTPNVLTDFSSRGYGPNYSIKPDLVAPGQDIYSATENGIVNNELYNPSGYASASGTSFSAPHVTGAVALVLQAHPKWTPAMVKSALTDSASDVVSLSDTQRVTPSVQQVGGGLLDVNAAVASTALIQPGSVTFGAVNVASGSASPTQTLHVSDVGGGAGTWTIAIRQLDGTAGVVPTVPTSIDVPSGGSVDLPLKMAIDATSAGGDYDGYIELTHNGQTRHVPYFVHVLSREVKSGSVLLVDDTTSRFQPQPPTAPVQRLDVTSWYEKSLSDLHRSFTYWDEGTLGTPSLQDMQKSTAVIFFTGNNLNGFAAQNSDPQSQLPPLSSVDVQVLQSYVDGGGKLFISGMGAALSDPIWSIVELGAVADNLSLYDDNSNDKVQNGGIAPTSPSALPDTRPGVFHSTGIFAGFKPLDYSSRGDGANDNRAVPNKAVGVVGVSGLEAVSGSLGDNLFSFGQPALKTSNVPHSQTGFHEKGINVAIVSSDEPSFRHSVSHHGRTVLFSFGFEGINNSSGHATRDQVMRRIFQWLFDSPTVRVVATKYRSGSQIKLGATLHSNQGAHAAVFSWQIGGRSLAPTANLTSFRFARAGNYRARVSITDSLGHVAVSPWTSIRVL